MQHLARHAVCLHALTPCLCKRPPASPWNQEHEAAVALSWCRLEDDLRQQRDNLAGLQQQLEAKTEECTDAQARARSTAQQLQQAQGELLQKVRHLALRTMALNSFKHLKGQAWLHLDQASCLTDPRWAIPPVYVQNQKSGMAPPWSF